MSLTSHTANSPRHSPPSGASSRLLPATLLIAGLSGVALAGDPPPPAQDPVEMYAQKERDRTMQVWARQQGAWPGPPRFGQQTLQRQLWETQRWMALPPPDHPWGPHCPPAPYCRPPLYLPQPPYMTCPPMWCP